MSPLPHRPLGSSSIDVSVLSLGSWQTYEHIPKERALAVMVAAREAGIDFLDDARYDDRTGRAPIPTGYSEVLFGELFRAAGWERDQVTVANKLWWEFWPDQSAAEELDGSLGRMGFDYVDLIYATPPPPELELAQVVTDVTALITAGKARAWGVGMWTAAQISETADIARVEGLPPSCALQEAYNLAWRSPIEDEQMGEALDRAGTSVVASAALAFGALTGKYAQPGSTGRISDQLEKPQFLSALRAAEPLGLLAERLDATPAAVAIAFSLSNPRVASVLFGATRPEQIAENAEAVRLLDRLSESDLTVLRSIE